MINKSVDYCVNSTDEKHYNRIKCSLPCPTTEYCKFLVTTLTTTCNFVLLKKKDYITVNFFTGKIWQECDYFINDDYSNLDNIDRVITLLNRIIEIKNEETFEKEGTTINFKLEKDNTGRIQFISDKNFEIQELSYNVRIILGMYNMEEEHIKSTLIDNVYIIQVNSVGFCLSTPIMYLLSNIGEQCYRTEDKNVIKGTKIVMKINNTFNPGSNILHPNSDFETVIMSTDLSNLEFRLVDAYLNEIYLLTPMYLTIHVDAIEDEIVTPDYTVPNIIDYELLNPYNLINTNNRLTFNQAMQQQIDNQAQEEVEKVLIQAEAEKRDISITSGENLKVEQDKTKKVEKNKNRKTRNTKPLIVTENMIDPEQNLYNKIWENIYAQQREQASPVFQSLNNGIDAVLEEMKEQDRIEVGTKIENGREVEKQLTTS